MTRSTKSPEGNPHRGSDFASFLEEDGIFPEVAAAALKRVIAIELQKLLEEEAVSVTELAARMKTSRAAVHRLLDPERPALTMNSLGRAAAALDRRIELRFVKA